MIARTFLFVSLLAALALADTYKVTADALNVRSGAGTGYSIVKQLSKGTTVEVSSISNGWAKVSGGYCSSQYLSKVSSSSSSTTTYTVNTAALNIRSGPGTGYSVVGSLSQGQSVAVSSIANGWAKISSGYVSSQYLTKSGSSSSGGSSSSSLSISQVSSPNYGSRNGWTPDVIVCHITDGGYEGSVSWLSNTEAQASCHYVVAKDGRITQLVPLDKASWCQGLTAASTARATSSIVKSRGINPNQYCIGIEHEGYGSQNGIIPETQRATTVKLIKFIKSEVKRIYGSTMTIDRTHVIGHYQVDPVNKPSCPGLQFPFDSIIAEVNA